MDSSSKRTSSAFHRFWIAASLLALLSVVVFDARILFSPETLQVQYTPDDAYYYLGLARNFSQTGQWSFDSGISTTTGFHPLLAYLLAVVYGVWHPTGAQFVHAGLLLCSLTTLAAASAAWIIGARRGKPEFLMVLTLILGSKFFLFDSVSIMEWSLVVLAAFLYAVVFFRAFGRARKRDIFLLFCLGFLGSVSRTDFGLWPFFLFLAGCLSFRRGKDRGALPAAFSGLLGASAGLLAGFLQNLASGGQLLQSSARMKSYWLHFMGSGYAGAANLFFKVFGLDPTDPPVLQILFCLLVAGLGLTIFWSAYRANRVWRDPAENPSRRAWTMMLAGAMTILGYLVFYAQSWGVQSWYTANLIVPVFCLLWVPAENAGYAIRGSRKPVLVGLISASLCFFVALQAAQVQSISAASSPWPHQQFMLEAGKYLAAQPLDERIGAWNAGIIGYFQGGNVINIDGLVNDEIYGFAVDNRLPDYLARQNIRYIIDFDNMLLDRRIRMRGGFDDPVFLGSLQPIRFFGNGRYAWKNLTLYQILP
jgi:hypothetical protein